MQTIDGRTIYSATDLVGFLECRHLTNLERAALGGHRSRPVRADPVLDRISQRGREHEERFLGQLSADGESVVEIKLDEVLPFADRLAPGRDATLAAMRAGAGVIYQAVLFDGRRLGFADFLRRVDEPSDLGAWSYEVWDTKLARHAKASAVLQLCMYSDMVAALQGRSPENMHLALGGMQRETVSFRVADYAAYYRSVARELESLLDIAPSFPVATEPEPVDHCSVCRWSLECRAQWRAADDLTLVANLSGRQRRTLRSADVMTRTALAQPATPLPDRFDGIGREALTRIAAQAEIQVRGGDSIIAERIPPPRDREGELVSDVGLLMLPEPSRGDLFFDIEGDPFFGTDQVDGIDYLFGVIEPGRTDATGQPFFHALWAIESGTVTMTAERRAFEEVIDLFMDRLRADPSMHIYHYAPYEPAHMKSLAGRYGTREEEVDQLLRGRVFVDLYRAVRQGIRASVESYSLKKLEPLYGFTRDIDLRDANTSIIEFETWLEMGQGSERIDLLTQIAMYNRDDCVSTLRLRDWLEQERGALAAESDGELSRPTIPVAEEIEDSEAQKATRQLVEELIADLPEDMQSAGDEERGRWLLAQLLNWHRREAKSFWWRYFFLKDELTDSERCDEPDALGDLTFEDSRVDRAPRARSTIYRFRFPPQEHAIRIGDSPHDPATGRAAGTVFNLDNEAGTIDLRLGTAQPAPSPTSLIPHDLVRPHPKPESLERIARWVIEHGINAPGKHRAVRDLLMRRSPRSLDSGEPTLVRDGEGVQDAARRLVLELDESYLAIQGPPGSGKSSVGARMIVDLVAAGKRIGVTAHSHAVIGNLLEKTAEVARDAAIPVSIGQRTTSEDTTFQESVRLGSTSAARDALADRSLSVVGGTSWLWANEEMAGSVDVLFVDEAGQLSLADALAASQCATNIVLLGDPQQLDQPLKGTHPLGSERSVLAHVLDGERVMPLHCGLFLDGTWRLHPRIASYTSEVFYEGRLTSRPGTELQNVSGAPPLAGSGIRFVQMDHQRRDNDSPEEAAAVARLVDDLVGRKWTNSLGDRLELDFDDVLVIAPYNAQVQAISEIAPRVRVGTVDKFQGQQAPVSIYSMTTSSPEEAPHGMEFLYNLNRLNVATSRARSIAIIIANPSLVRVRCRTPRQMLLANALARFVEMASDTD